MALAIGVDVGGTKVAAGVVDEDGVVLVKTRRPTPSQSPGDVEQTVADLVEELRQDHVVAAVGIGAAGFIDADRSTVLFAPNLAWRNEPLREAMQKLVDLPVVVENDANAMAWAEHRFGAGKGQRDLVCVTVGTGIGGGIVLEGSLYRGTCRWSRTAGAAAAGRTAAGSSTAPGAPWCGRPARSPTCGRGSARGCSSSAAGSPRASPARP
jgi:glucokinase